MERIEAHPAGLTLIALALVVSLAIPESVHAAPTGVALMLDKSP